MKQHRWFSTLKWGLLRNETPPIRPTIQKDGVGHNVRHMKESISLDLEGGTARKDPATPTGGVANASLGKSQRERGRGRKDPLGGDAAACGECNVVEGCSGSV